MMWYPGNVDGTNPGTRIGSFIHTSEASNAP